jgi:hypothetical protein
MKQTVDYRLVLGIPGGAAIGLALSYLAGVLAGVDRELAFDCVTVAVPIFSVVVLRGVRRLSERILSLDIGALITVLTAVVFLALRSISLALSDGGRLFYFAIACSSILTIVAYRLMRSMRESSRYASRD